MNDLGYRLKKVRKARRMTRKEIGDLIGINYADTRLDAYETGKTYPREKMLSKLAEALDVSSSWLATGELDDKTVKSLEEKGIFYVVFKPFSEEIKYYYQYTDFLARNKNVIEDTLTIEDYKALTNIIVNKIEEKHGSTGMLIAPVTEDEYNDYMQQQQQDALDAGEGYVDNNGHYIPYNN